jgi:hypothetical protein
MTGLPVTGLGDISRIIVLPKGCAFFYGLLKKYRRLVLFYTFSFDSYSRSVDVFSW